MKVDTREINPAFKSIIQNPDQTVFLDANFFIPPDRSEYLKVKPYAFGDFKDCWLILLEPGGIDHSESSRNNQSELIRNSQCTCLAN